MKIAVVGCGALGSYYGAKLWRDGQEDHFLLRSDYKTVRRHGVEIQSPEGNFNARPRCAQTPGEIGHVDLVIVGLKTTANDQFAKLLPPMVGPKTAILTLQNGLGNEEQLAKIFPAEQILGGLCFVCLNRIAPGVIKHIGQGRITIGEFQRWPEPRTHDIASAFRHAGIPCDVTDNLERAHWEKLVWNIPFNGLGVASSAGMAGVHAGTISTEAPHGPCLTTDRLLDGAEWEKLVRDLMQEVISIARAKGMTIREQFIETLIERTRPMGAYKASTLVDFERGWSLELQSLFLEPLRQARETGIDTPHLSALCSILISLSERQTSSRDS